MDRAANRVDVASVSPAIIALLTVAMFIALALIPSRRRFHIAVGFAMTWSLIGQLPELPVHAMAKGSLAGAFLAVAAAALLHPGPRLRLAPVVIWWPLLAVVSVMFVLYVDTLLYAMVLRVQWILLCITAVLCCRTITSREAADALARAIAVGLVIGVGIAATSIVLYGSEAFHIGRFAPYGANSNQVGVVFTAAVPFSLYAALRAQRKLTRYALAGMTTVVVGMLIMTASRTSIAVTAICLIPFLLTGMRRAVLILSVVALAVMVILPFAYQPQIKPDASEQYGLSRLDSLETERYAIFARYLDESISKRPVTGLLGTSEQSVLKDEEIGKHPHNAYLEMMYLGGVIYTLPMLFLVIFTIAAAVRVFIDRKQLPIDPLLALIFVFVLAAVYVHAMFGQNGWYPTSAWAFIHVVLSSYVLTASNWLQRSARTRRVRRGRLVVVSGVLATLLLAACSGGNGKGNSEKTVEPRADDAGIGQGQPRREMARPGRGHADAIGPDGKFRNWKNQPLPENATPRAIDVLDHLEVDRSEAHPDLLCAVKLDNAADAPELRKRARELRVPMLIMAYQWIVDWRKDGVFDDRDKERFAKWIDLNIKPDSRQLVAIDYEHPYWPELRKKDTSPERLAEITAIYRDVLAFAKSKRPKARWGFFGLPQRNLRMGPPWRERIKVLGEQLLRNQDVVFLSIYDLNAGESARDLEAVRTYVELSLAEARGRPVYAFARGRYGGRTELRDEPIPEEEFKQHVGAALDARWNDGKRDHQLAGVILWDSKLDKRAKPSALDDLYKLYARQLSVMTDLVRVKRPRRAGQGSAPPAR